jgi:transcriptional regulator with XRE-family HTH domain
MAGIKRRDFLERAALMTGAAALAPGVGVAGSPVSETELERLGREVPVGERIRAYRIRRGLSQETLAGLVDHSRSWLAKVEANQLAPENYRVLIELAHVLHVGVQDLTGLPLDLAPNGEQFLADAMGDVRRALVAQVGCGQEGYDLQSLQAGVAHTRKLRQASRYSDLAELLPALVVGGEMVIRSSRNTIQRQAVRAMVEVYCSAGALCQQAGERHLAWVASDRAHRLANETDDPLLPAMTARRMANALLRDGHMKDAFRLTTGLAETLDRLPASPERISLQGALLLKSAIASARAADGSTAETLLDAARRLAERLGYDGNHAWTVFGPANVQLHAVHAALELGDPREALRRADQLDPDQFPEQARERRSRYWIDVARAYAGDTRRNDAAAVSALLRADQIAPEEVRYQVVIRGLVRTLLKREKRSATPGLRGLARRMGVLAEA